MERGSDPQLLSELCTNQATVHWCANKHCNRQSNNPCDGGNTIPPSRYPSSRPPRKSDRCLRGQQSEPRHRGLAANRSRAWWSTLEQGQHQWPLRIVRREQWIAAGMAEVSVSEADLSSACITR